MLIRLAFLCIGVLVSAAASAQSAPPVERDLPYWVLGEIDSYVSSISPEDRGEPFVVFRDGWDRSDTLEVAVLTGPRSYQDSVRFSQPGRVLTRGNYQYGVAYAGEYRGFQDLGGHGTRLQCITTDRRAYIIRYTESIPDYGSPNVVSAVERLIPWCMAPE